MLRSTSVSRGLVVTVKHFRVPSGVVAVELDEFDFRILLAAESVGAHALVAGTRADVTEDAVVADTDDVSEASESLVCWYADLIADTAGCTSVKTLAIPGWNVSSRRDSRQYESHRPETVLAVLREHTGLDVEARPQ